jgi:AraC-like DNA-binding protein
VKESIFNRREVVIPGQATITAFKSEGQGSQEYQAGIHDVYMICAQQGSIDLHASFIPHPLTINSSEAIFLAFPRGEWSYKILTRDTADFYVMNMDVSSLHKLINPQFDDKQFAPVENMNMRDLMRLIPVNPSLMICFEQLMYHKLRAPFHLLFEKAKFLEIFSLLLESAFGQPMESCPVILSPVIENKLKQVRRHIIERLDEVPDPDALAVLYELPKNTLREGYRYIYGKTIHQYHSDHKLESAMQMLNQGELLVKEVAFKIGYQNPSHFISAFKKKFGYTPKQYLRREVVA